MPRNPLETHPVRALKRLLQSQCGLPRFRQGHQNGLSRAPRSSVGSFCLRTSCGIWSGLDTLIRGAKRQLIDRCKEGSSQGSHWAQLSCKPTWYICVPRFISLIAPCLSCLTNPPKLPLQVLHPNLKALSRNKNQP